MKSFSWFKFTVVLTNVSQYIVFKEDSQLFLTCRSFIATSEAIEIIPPV